MTVGPRGPNGLSGHKKYLVHFLCVHTFTHADKRQMTPTKNVQFHWQNVLRGAEVIACFISAKTRGELVLYAIYKRNNGPFFYADNNGPGTLRD